MNDFELSAQQKLAAQLLATGTAKGLVAAEIGINRRTLFTWEQQSAFQAYLQMLLSDADSQPG